MRRHTGRSDPTNLRRIFQVQEPDKKTIPLVSPGLCADEQRILFGKEPARGFKTQRCNDSTKDEGSDQESLAMYCYRMKREAEGLRVAFMILAILALWFVIFIYTSSKQQITHGPEDLPVVQVDGIRVYRYE